MTLPLKDTEVRGLVLQKFYDLRHTSDRLELEDIVSVAPDDSTRILNICEQLGQHGLIEWKPLRGAIGIVEGLGRITARGVDVIEGTAQSPIAVTIHGHVISQSSNVQIGERNVQGISITGDKVAVAIDDAGATLEEKSEAKSLLKSVLENPLLKMALSKFGLHLE